MRKDDDMDMIDFDKEPSYAESGEYYEGEYYEDGEYYDDEYYNDNDGEYYEEEYYEEKRPRKKSGKKRSRNNGYNGRDYGYIDAPKKKKSVFWPAYIIFISN